MGTSLENCLTNFDLDLLFGPASSLESIPHNTGKTDHGGQISSMEQSLSCDNYKVEIVKLKNDNESLKNQCGKLEGENFKLKREYNGLKDSYTKLASDYEELHKESRDHALAAISSSKKCEEIKHQVEEYSVALNAHKDQCNQFDWTVQGLQSHIRQLESLIMELQNKNEDLKTSLNTERVNVKAGRKMISTLNSNAEILTDYLCLFGCVIGGKRQIDKGIKRLLKKHCKQGSPHRKKSVDVEEFHSIDTGRGSSLAFSDCERSNCSPAYSAILSPLSSCTSIIYEPAKLTRDGVTSPHTNAKAMDVATSPIMFEIMTTLKTCEVGTNTATDQAASIEVCEGCINKLPVRQDTRTPVFSITTRDSTTSPTPFNQESKTPTPIKTCDVGINTSLVQPVAKSPVVSMKTREFGTSPIPFEVKTPIASMKTRHVGTNTTPPKEVKTPPGSRKLRHIGTSPMPVQNDTERSEASTKTCEVATSPIHFTNNQIIVMNKTHEIGPGIVSWENDKISTTAKTESFQSINSSIANNCNNQDIDDGVASSRSVFDSADFTHDDTDDEASCPTGFERRDSNTGLDSTITFNKISERLEFQQQASSSQDNSNDLEVQMILKKQRLNFEMLSPMSLTPESEVNDQNYDPQQEINDMNYESDASDQSLHIHEQINTESNVDDNNVNHKNDNIEATRNPDHSDAKKCSISQPVVSHSTDIVSAKTHKNKKLNNLQKIYKNNVAKSKIKSELPPCRKQLRPKPITIAPVKYSLEALSLNKEKAVRIMAEHKAKLMQSKNSDAMLEVHKDSMNCSLTASEPSISESAQMSSPSLSKGSLSNHELSEHSVTKAILAKEMKSSLKDLVLKKNVRHTMEPLPESNTSNTVPTSTPSANSSIPRKRVHASTESLLNVSTSAVTKCADLSITLLANGSQSEYEPRNDSQPLPSLSKPTSSLRADLSVASLPNKERETITTYHPALAQPLYTGERESFDVASDNNYEDLKTPPTKRSRTSNDPVINDVVVLQSISPQQDNNIIRNQNEDAANNNDPRTVGKTVGNSSDSHKPILDRKINEDNVVATPEESRHRADYNDINMFMTAPENSISIENNRKEKMPDSVKKMINNLLSISLDKYASHTVAGPFKKPKNEKKESIRLHELVAKKISDGIAKCTISREAQGECKTAMNELVSNVLEDNRNNVVCGLVKYLNDPAHVKDLHNKHGKSHKPCMTQKEKLLVNLIQDMQRARMDIVDETLDVIECTMFSLEKGATPTFEIIESMSHFFAVICKIFMKMSRLRMFMMNAMYCISFKAMVLVKQCLDVCPNILPCGNSDIAKIPLIRCFVFMLHFYTCDDPHRRVQELRDRLRNQYQYNLQDENETTILYMFKTTICLLSENKIEKEMLRICLIVLAKRRGTKWCHKNLIQRIILPMVKGEIEVTNTARRFCITMLGPLIKPYKNEMMVHCEEVVNVLMSMLKESHPQEIKEDVLSSLICMDVQSTWVPVNKYLMNWTSPAAVSPEFEAVLCRYIRSKHLNRWRQFYKNHFNDR